MRENAKKRDVLLLGPAKDAPHLAPRGVAPRDEYVAEGDILISLGVPFGNNINEEEWWEGRCGTVRRRMSEFGDLGSASLVARNAVVQSKWYGSFRYWLFSLIMPVKIRDNIARDAQRLLWSAEPKLEDEDGEGKRVRAFIHKKARNLPRNKGGAGTMDWTAHVNAFYAQWVPRYLDPSERPWKEVLDFWIVRDEQRGRGVVMSAEEQVWKRLPQKSYFRKCFSEFSKLKVKQDTTVMPLNLQAEYLFENHRFKIRLHRKKQSHNARVKQWHKYMQTYRSRRISS